MKRSLMTGVAMAALSVSAYANCAAVTVDDMQGLQPEYPQQFELAAFEEQAACDLEFSQNPEISELNAEIIGNGELGDVADRLPAEPLVVAPYETLGQYGGTLRGLSKATESGTSDLLSVRHVNFVRYSDDLKTIVPNVAKSWGWNEDFTELRFTLRAGHKWSDGSPFTANDVAFWYNHIILNKDIYDVTPEKWLFAGEPAKVEAVDDLTVVFTLPVPAPGLLNRFAVDYGQPFQPAEFLKQYMPEFNETADADARAQGFENAAQALDFYYAGSDWKDVPTPLLRDAETVINAGRAVTPTLESHIVVADTAEGRKLVANPYFHMVDTAGNQLPYISRIDESYVTDKEVQNLMIIDGKVDWKQQAVFLEDFPLLKENEGNGNYTVSFAPGLGATTFYAFNQTHKDPVLAGIFSDPRFGQAMSVAINRDEINEIVYLGQGTAEQAFFADPQTVDFIPEDLLTEHTEYDPEAARALLAEMGLEDSDGDGTLERPDGKPLVVRLVYSSQGAALKMQELVRDYWSAVGVRIDLKEVTSDEYRAAGNNNDLDITVWKQDGTSAPLISQDSTMMVPPYGDFFNPGNGFAWAQWVKTDGAEGTEPPADIMRNYELAEAFLQEEMGSAESDRLGAEIARIHADRMLKIGIIGRVVDPYLSSNSLGNVKDLTAKSYDYYWTYPYRAQQWFFEN